MIRNEFRSNQANYVFKNIRESLNSDWNGLIERGVRISYIDLKASSLVGQQPHSVKDEIFKVPKDMGETFSRLYGKNEHQIPSLERYMFARFGIHSPYN